ncbi:hypothetical protein Tco_0678879 [Tanacetum coccineum]|uniref:Reverse transcriptase domain-containing protein n=1 Tax=Tanacetum coccineum TaxID=301880 RepID=A0ABQ4XHJ0_9ASTR
MQTQMGQLEEAFQERPLGVLPSDTETYPREERKAVTTMSGLTLDGSFIPHSNSLVYQDEELEPETITEVVEIASSQRKPLVPPPKTLSFSAPKPKEDPKPNPHQPSIPYLSQLQEENFQALENPTGRAEHFIYSINIIDSPCEEISNQNKQSSYSTTSHSNHSLLEYELFCFDVDHIEENSSGSTTSHSDLSLLEHELFHFDLLIDPLPPTGRSNSQHEEFADGLAHIISPPEYDRFYFDIEPDLGELTILYEENISKDSTKELTSPELNDFPLLLSDCDTEKFSEIDLLVLFPSRNKDKIFDPGIFIFKGVQS